MRKKMSEKKRNKKNKKKNIKDMRKARRASLKKKGYAGRGKGPKGKGKRGGAGKRHAAVLLEESSTLKLAERFGLSASAYPHQWYGDGYVQCQYSKTSPVHAVVRLAQWFRNYPRVNTAYVRPRQLKENLHNKSTELFLRGVSLAEVFRSLVPCSTGAPWTRGRPSSEEGATRCGRRAK